jgi:magnesium transporter
MSRKRRHPRNGKLRTKPRTEPGTAPGTLRIDPEAPQPIITVFAFTPDQVREEKIQNPQKLRQYLAEWPVTWVNVDGLGSAEILQQVADIFKLHPLALEDVVNVHQRAKIEHFADHHFLVMHLVEIHERLEVEQVSLFFGKNFVLTFQEDVGDCLDPVRERIRQNVGRIRLAGSDYLMYAILDAAIDHYFPVLEAYGELLEHMEERIIKMPDYTTVSEIHEIKRGLLTLRRLIWPQRDALNTLVRDPVPLVSDETRIYLRDCYDHVARIIDLLESYRELGSDMMELQLSSVSNRINEVMRILTVIATIFIPLTFISSIWGMNFDTKASPWNMPELEWYWGYPFAWALMISVAIWQLAFFYRKGWLGKRGRARFTLAAGLPDGSNEQHSRKPQ